MVNIYELEKRWLKYKIKSYIPHLSIFVSIIIILVSSYIFYDADMLQKTKREIHEPLPTQPKTVVLKQTQPTLEKKTPIKPLDIQEIPLQKNKNKEIQKLFVVPSMQFIQNIQNAPTIQQPKKTHPPKKRPPKKDTPKKVTHKQQTQEPQKSSKISIQTSDAYSELKDVIHRFQKNNNPALSLFVAKKYYKLKEYNKAYNYALKTNELNNNIEASWIIFAKSLVKLHKKDKAIATLRSYIRHSNSNKAKILLNEILTGKLHAD